MPTAREIDVKGVDTPSAVPLSLVIVVVFL